MTGVDARHPTMKGCARAQCSSLRSVVGGRCSVVAPAGLDPGAPRCDRRGVRRFDRRVGGCAARTAGVGHVQLSVSLARQPASPGAAGDARPCHPRPSAVASSPGDRCIPCAADHGPGQPRRHRSPSAARSFRVARAEHVRGRLRSRAPACARPSTGCERVGASDCKWQVPADVSAWFIASLALLVGMVPLLVVLERGDTMSRLIALETMTAMTTLLLLTLAEAFERSFYAMLALVLAVTSMVGSLVYARFLERYL